MKLSSLSICVVVFLWCFTITNGDSNHLHSFDVLMPGANPEKVDDYLCTAQKIPNGREKYVVRFEPKTLKGRAHHMLLYGCSNVRQDLMDKGVWSCGIGICDGMKIMFAWAKSAGGLTLPDDVAFVIDGDTDVKYIALQVHYQRPMQDDHSGVTLKYTLDPPKYMAGILLLVTGNIYIPPNTPEYHTDIVCKSNVDAPIHMFATRAHAHKQGRVITGYTYDKNKETFKLFAKGNPLWPQTFYPMKEPVTVTSEDYLVGRCVYSSVDKDEVTHAGAGGNDEMCNLYVMYYTDRQKGRSFYGCAGVALPITDEIPENSLQPLPPNPILEEEAAGIHIPPAVEDENPPIPEVHYGDLLNSRRKKGHSLSQKRPYGYSDYYDYRDYDYPEDSRSWREDQPEYKVQNWSLANVNLGQVTAVSQDYRGNIVIFHRGSHVWDGSSFNLSNHYMQRNKGPINTDTIFMIHPNTSKIVHQWGKDLFYLPHGLTIDMKDNVWITDVAMHQVFKFAPFGDGGKPKKTLGTAFVPGNDDSHFCKPSSVAVLGNGEFFVADGYCNSRLIHYTSSGEIKRVWNSDALRQFGAQPLNFKVVHKVVAMEVNRTVCVADRENGRVVCVDYERGPVINTLHNQLVGTRLFSMSYSPYYGGIFATVNGPYGGAKVQGVILEYATEKSLGTFSPNDQGFSNPHDVYITKDAKQIYVVEIGPNKVWKFERESTLEDTVKLYEKP